MRIRFDILCLGACLAMIGATVTPMRADDWNKETTLNFSGPVEVPGKVLAAGKYVFKIADSESERNIVEIFSESANGRQSLVATILAVPIERETTPESPLVQFEERPSGRPEAIRSWFYPGENTGWEFIYPKGEQTRSNTMSSNAMPSETFASPAPAAAPAPAPVLSAPPALPPEPVASVATTADDVPYIAQNDAPALVPPPANDDQVFAFDRTLPETAGQSRLEVITGVAMFMSGGAVVFATRRKAQV